MSIPAPPPERKLDNPSPSREASPVEKFLARLDDVRQTQPGHWMARCPAHPDHNPSLSVRATDGGVLWHCFAGCASRNVLTAVGLTPEDFGVVGDLEQVAARTAARLGGAVAGLWTYLGVQRTPVMAVLRVATPDGKQYRPLHPTEGGWRLGDPPGPLALYHLNDVAAHAQVYICEGEKAVDAAWSVGLAAATSAHGAKAAKKTDWSPLAGKNTIILPDNDDAGRKYAADVVRLVKAAGVASVRVVDLPGLPESGDIVDFVAARPGKSGAEIKAEIEQLAASAPDARAKRLPAATSPAHGGAGNRVPVIRLGNRGLADVTHDAIAALESVNSPPQLFCRGTRLVRIRRTRDDAPTIEVHSNDSLRGALARAARWILQIGDSPIQVFPPKDVVADVQSLPQWPFPELLGIVEAPVFAADGTLQDKPGYSPVTRLLYHPTHEPLPPIPAQPTAAEVQAARHLIVNELLGDFPFVDNASLATAIAAMLLPLARPMIDGPTPNHAFESPTPGTGKNLLVDSICAPAFATPPAVLSEAHSDEEWRKRITAALRCGAPVVLLDNLNAPLNTSALAAALTSTWWTDRELGRSNMLRLPITCMWLTTGNNISLSRELARRTVLCRIDAKTDAPEKRSGFRHPDLRAWSRLHRSELLVAALTLVQAWVAAGCPEGRQRTTSPVILGSFEHWSRVIGGILDGAGVPGFLANHDELMNHADDCTAEWRAFISAWYAEFGTTEARVDELLKRVLQRDQNLLATTLASAPTEQGRRVKLGQELKKLRDCTIGKFVIHAPRLDHHGSQVFQLALCAENRPGIGGGIGGHKPCDGQELPENAESADSPVSQLQTPCAMAASAAAPTSVVVLVEPESAESAMGANSLKTNEVTTADSSADSPPIPPPTAPEQAAAVDGQASVSPGHSDGGGNDEPW